MRRVTPAICVLVNLVVAALLVLPAAADWTGAPSPHDSQHLVVVGPADFRPADAPAPVPIKDGESTFGTAISAGGPLTAQFDVGHDGKYVLWLRVGSPADRPVRLGFQLEQDGKTLLQGDLADATQTVARGGPAGYAAYARQAMKSAPGAKVGDLVQNSQSDAAGKLADQAAEFQEELLADIARESGKTRTKSWIEFARLEHPKGIRPYYWWRLGLAELKPGRYTLHLDPPAPRKNAKPTEALLVDTAFASTFTSLAYPYNGDIAAPPDTYIRFRIDEVPEGGVTIGASMRIHYDPWGTGAAVLNPGGMSIGKAEPHTSTGLTCWYRLQDLKNAPSFGASEAQLHLNLAAAKGSSSSQGAQVKNTQIAGGARGATQFAIYPHDDYVLREIDWNEPEGLRISLATDMKTYLHKLRTLRDHARENYERAWAATGERLFPLTRGPLYFGNAWGQDNGASGLYMVKTLRWLGFNCVGDSTEDPVLNRRLFGWTSHGAQYWPPAFMPYNEDETRRKYAEHYKNVFTARHDFYEGVSIFQVADEPGEISRDEMSSPLWRFRKDEQGEKYADLAGGGILATRKSDYEHCVLEGMVEKHGYWIGFRLGADDPLQPRRYVEWQIGRVSVNDEHNLATVGQGISSPGRGTLARPGAVVAATPTRFKIVHDGTAAALYIDGKLMQTQNNVPAKGGFAFTGPAKAVRQLRLRTIGPDEHVASDQPEVALGGKKKSGLDDLSVEELLGSGKEPKWASAKPLRKAIEEDWMIGGGMPEAQQGFRRWAQEQGLKPELFGKRSWDEVQMLTVAELVESPADARLFYWSRRYSGYLTPKMFAMASDAIRASAPNKEMLGFVALSGHALYFPSAMPLDMFQLASLSPAMMPGVSDWMSYGSWRWDSHQAVAFSVAPYNAGARRWGQEPITYPMMHCVWPSQFRSYTMLGNQVRYISFYNFGPAYQVTEGFWSESDGCYQAVHRTANHASLMDDVLAQARMRPSRVAMLYSMANEYWNPQSSFADKRASFLALSHEYFQPELVTEEQVAAGALEHYDALYVLEPVVATAAQSQIADWVRQGGRLWTCADALARNEFNEPADLVANLAGIQRTLPALQPGETAAQPSTAKSKETTKPDELVVSPLAGKATFRPHSVHQAGVPEKIDAGSATPRAAYNDGRPAWLEQKVGQGKVVYIGHRVGLTYTSKAVRVGGLPVVWGDTGRALLTAPLLEARIDRELVLSQPLVMASALSSETGTVIVLYNMRAQPCRNLEVSLHEPQRPLSVERVDDDRLVATPFEHRDGRVVLTLPELADGQMILVRRTAAPPDQRLADMQKRTDEQLASEDAQAISAGAWTAGFYPDWGLGDRLIPLLKHPHWDVRRVAAESLGRLRYAAAADALAATIAAEQDAHVLGDALVALGRIGDGRSEAVCLEHLEHSQAFVRMQAVRAIGEYHHMRAPEGGRRASRSADAGNVEAGAARRIAVAALRDPDLRVRREAIALVGELDGKLTVNEAVASDPQGQDRAYWVAAIAGNDAAFEAYRTAGLPGDDDLLLAVAARRRAPELADQLVRRVDELLPDKAQPLIWAAFQQQDPKLARLLLARQDKIAPALRGYLPYMLEKTFDARLGNVLADWEGYIQKAVP